MLPRKYLEHQRGHPVLWVSLFCAMLIPPPAAIALLGWYLGPHLRQIKPVPGWLDFFWFVPLVLALFVGCMLIGAISWLAVARRFVPSETARPLFSYLGVPVFSALSARLFQCAYGQRGGRSA